MDIINEIDGVEKTVGELEAQVKTLDEFSAALEKKVELAKDQGKKTSVGSK